MRGDGGHGRGLRVDIPCAPGLLGVYVCMLAFVKVTHRDWTLVDCPLLTRGQLCWCDFVQIYLKLFRMKRPRYVFERRLT